jgi:hypothetical protein
VLAGTGIPEEFRRNLKESGEIAGQMPNAGIYRNWVIPVNMAKNRNFLTPAKRSSCEKIPPEKTRIRRNPEESLCGG